MNEVSMLERLLGMMARTGRTQALHSPLCPHRTAGAHTLPSSKLLL